MAFGDVIQSNSGTAAATTVTPTLPGAVTAGNLLILHALSDDYNGTPPAYWTQRAEMEQQTFHGAYLWERFVLANGETIGNFTLPSASRCAWELLEIAGPFAASPYDTSQGNFVQASIRTITSDTITPTSGGRLLLAAHGYHTAGATTLDVVANWTAGFTSIKTYQTSGVSPSYSMGVARLVVTANGSTGYAPASDMLGGGFSAQSLSALIISYKQGASSNKPVKVWSGSAWVTKPVKVWNGTSWVTKPAKIWNGTAWV
jgi:hypothetical protein